MGLNNNNNTETQMHMHTHIQTLKASKILEENIAIVENIFYKGWTGTDPLKVSFLFLKVSFLIHKCTHTYLRDNLRDKLTHTLKGFYKYLY